MNWNLDDKQKFVLVHRFDFPRAYTWGSNYKKRREYIRLHAAKRFPNSISSYKWWGFRIYVKKYKKKFDIENVIKLIGDAFSKEMIQRDNSQYTQLGLYDDDTIDYVKIIEIAGERTQSLDYTTVEIFAYK